ncbi:MAG: BON domain-containing protein, partial [Pseudomonadota bacterium]
MKCRPWLWLWGLLPLALVVFLGVIGERQRVERDLSVRSEQTLEAEGLGWARLTFEGRDGVLSGNAPNTADRVLAADIARNVHGVRVIRNDATVVQAVSPYTWSARRTAQGITLDGHVADAETRTALLADADDLFDGAITDEMTIAQGAPEAGVWGRGTAFALRQIARLGSGGVALSDTTLNIEGVAASPRAYTQLLDALRDRLPAGWTLGQRNVTAPDVETYTWSFDRLGADVVLNGYVPDAATRDRLLAAAKARYPDATITDRMLVAGGAPDGFAGAAEVAINETASFREVRVALRDGKLTVTGLADTQLDARDVIGRIAGTAGGFTVSNDVRALRN